LPSIIVIVTSVIMSRGSPSSRIRSASLPTVIEPVLSAMPIPCAAFIVIALSASRRGSPAFAQYAALNARYCTGTSGWSVHIATLTLLLYSIAAFAVVSFASSGFPLSLIIGPTKAVAWASPSRSA
jgi:hypothetical protein